MSVPIWNFLYERPKGFGLPSACFYVTCYAVNSWGIGFLKNG